MTLTKVSTYDYEKKQFDYYEVSVSSLAKTPPYGHRLPKGKNVNKNIPEMLSLKLPSDARYIGSGGQPIGQICCSTHTGVGSIDNSTAFAVGAGATLAVTVLHLGLLGLTAYGGYSLYKKWKK